MMRKIVLHGKLKKLYEDEIKLEVGSVAEAVRGLCYQIDGFKEELREGHYRIYLGEKDPEALIGESMLHFNLGQTPEIHIEPVLEGDKRGGIGKAIIGVALVGLAFATGGTSLTFAGGQFAVAGAGVNVAAGTVISSAVIGKLGVALALGGISQLLSPEVKNDGPQSFERPEERPSFLFSGPVNTSEQGGPVPLAYGLIRVGSTIVSSGLSNEKI